MKSKFYVIVAENPEGYGDSEYQYLVDAGNPQFVPTYEGAQRFYDHIQAVEVCELLEKKLKNRYLQYTEAVESGQPLDNIALINPPLLYSISQSGLSILEIQVSSKKVS